MVAIFRGSESLVRILVYSERAAMWSSRCQTVELFARMLQLSWKVLLAQ